MMVWQQMSEGRSSTARAASIALVTAPAQAVDARHHVPAVGLEASRRGVGEPAGDLAVDGDAVVVVEDDELAQAPRAGERARLVRHALHEAPVAAEHVRVVIDDIEAGTIELTREQLLGERHADPVGESLPERPRGRLDAALGIVL